MTVYLVVYAVSLILISFGESEKRFVRFLAAISAIIPLAWLGYVRDYEVGGPDTLLYGNPIFQQAVSAGDWQGFHASQDVEIGYQLLNYVVARFSSDPHVFYFVLGLLTNGLAAWAVVNARRLSRIHLMWAVYLFTIFPQTFNLLRQSVALSAVLLGVSFLIVGRKLPAVVAGVFGVLWHDSAVIGLGLMMLLWVSMRASRRRTWLVVLAVAASLVVLFSEQMISLFSAVIGNDQYAEYTEAGAREGGALGIDAFYRLVPLFLAWSALSGSVLSPNLWDSSRREEDHWVSVLYSLAVMLVVEVLLLPIRQLSYPLYRTLMYFGYMRVFAYAQIVSSFATKYRLPATAGLYIFVFLYFLNISILSGNAAFSSELLGVTGNAI